MNDNIRQKLFNYSETPPVSAWNRIAEALEENPEYAQKLDDFEQQPPAGIWEKIDQQLSATKVIPLRTKLFKYAMAAAVLIAITVGSIIYLKSGTASGLTHTAQKSDSNNSANSFTDSQSQSGSKTNVARYDDPSGGDNTNVNGTAAITDRTTVHYATQVRI